MDFKMYIIMCRKSWTIVCESVWVVNTNETIVSADLGNSSNYSNKIQYKIINYSIIIILFVKLWRS